jgi:hypothetical protein
MVLDIAFAGFGGLTLIFFVVRAVTGQEVLKLGKRHRPTAQIRREYTALSVMSVGIILLVIPGLSPWWGMAATWLGLIGLLSVSKWRNRTPSS